MESARRNDVIAAFVHVGLKSTLEAQTAGPSPRRAARDGRRTIMSGPPEYVGIFAATVTPFSPEGRNVDEAGIKRLTDRLVAAGVSGLVPCGSTGEFTHLTHEERVRVVEVFIEAAAGRIPIIAHTGALTTAETVELSIKAEAAGSSAVMVVPPFYDMLSWRELVAHYSAVANAVDVPIVFYNIPSVTGVNLTPDKIVELVDAVPSVRYLKDTSGNASAQVELVERYSDRVTTFNGSDSLMILGLASGTRASILGAVNVVPEVCVELWRLVVEQADLATAHIRWKQLWPILNFLETHPYSPSVKAGCDLIGETAGPPRRPFLPLEPSDKAQLGGLLRAAGIATVD